MESIRIGNHTLFVKNDGKDAYDYSITHIYDNAATSRYTFTPFGDSIYLVVNLESVIVSDDVFDLVKKAREMWTEVNKPKFMETYEYKSIHGIHVLKLNYLTQSDSLEIIYYGNPVGIIGKRHDRVSIDFDSEFVSTFDISEGMMKAIVAIIEHFKEVKGIK